jgi:hypothetical protein
MKVILDTISKYETNYIHYVNRMQSNRLLSQLENNLLYGLRNIGTSLKRLSLLDKRGRNRSKSDQTP